MIRSYALWLGGIIIALWAFRDFHLEVPVEKIRYGTERERYFLGIAIYISGWVLGYFLVTQAITVIEAMVPEPLANKLPSALVAATITIVVPFLPYFSRFVDRLRAFARMLALYPQATQRLTDLLTIARFRRDEGAVDALARELIRFGLSLPALEKHVSPSVIRILWEIQTVRDRMRSRQNVGPQRFFRARKEAVLAAEQSYRGLLRGVARVGILGASASFDTNDFYPLSEFVAHRAEAVLSSYRALISEAALACFSSGKRRRSFIEGFGYSAPRDWLLPYWPLVAVFVVDILLFFVPVALKTVPLPPPALILSNGLAQVIAVAWAVFPKAHSNFARPSLRSLPWRSYIVFGGCSYLTGAVISLPIAYANPLPANAFPIDINTTILVLLFTIYFPVITVFVSFLTDLHLRLSSRSRFGRTRDAIVGGFSMLSANLTFRLIVLIISGHWLGRPVFAVILALLGAIVGALIPRTAATYLSIGEEDVLSDARLSAGK